MSLGTACFWLACNAVSRHKIDSVFYLHEFQPQVQEAELAGQQEIPQCQSCLEICAKIMPSFKYFEDDKVEPTFFWPAALE